jgi:hypothetical protein
MVSRIAVLVLFLFLIAGAALEESANAQTAPNVVASGAMPTGVVDSTVGDALRSLAARAGVVFVGQVTRIERKGGVVEISFAVQQAVAGRVGAIYKLREWGGLWAGGQARYRVGQRAMFFLRAPHGGANVGAGLSSPVDGMDGVVPLVPMGADAVPLLDVRRLATRVLRARGQPMVGEAVVLQDAARIVSAGKMEPKLEPALVQLPRNMRPAVGVDHVLR